MTGRRVLLAGGLHSGLAAAALMESLKTEGHVIVSGNHRDEAARKLELQRHVTFSGEWQPKAKPTPKKGKPTKAQKKAAKRQRTRSKP